MADHDVILDGLGRVREAGLFDGTVIDVTGPTVGLNTDRNVNLRYFQRTADVADCVVVRIGYITNDRILRRHCCNTRIQTTDRITRVSIRIGILDRRQRMSIQQSFNNELITQVYGQGQHFAVIRLT